MFTVPIGGFSAIIYVIILLVGAVIRRSRKGTLGTLGRTLLHLIDRENDGPLRRAFAYSVASGIFLVFLGVFGTVVLDQARAFSLQYPTGKIFYSSEAFAQEIGEQFRGKIEEGATPSSRPVSENPTGSLGIALCVDGNFCPDNY